MQQLVPVLTAAIAAAAALLGAFGGPWFKARTDVDQWRRDKRLDAYADLARTVHDLTEAIMQRLDVAQPGFAETSPQTSRQDLEKAMFELARAASRAQLLAPPAVCNASVELVRYATRATHPLRQAVLGFAAQDMLAVNDGLNLRYDAFMDAARRDLGTQ